MSTLELKGIAMEKIAALNSEAALKEVIAYLENLSSEENKSEKVKQIFDKAVTQYGNALKKLAK
jgi:cytochrome c553